MNSQDKATISAGDIIELIPGHHLYKYEVLGGEKKGSSVNTGKRYSSGGRKGNEVSSGNEGSGRNSEVFCLAFFSFLFIFLGGEVMFLCLTRG